MPRRSRSLATAGALALSLTAAPAAIAAPGTGAKGPTTTVNPYVLPVADGVQTTSLLTVGDQPAGSTYKMVGIPDGLGARKLLNGDVQLFMNHELGFDKGVVRAHGQKGSFVSDYRIDPATLAVKSGKDLIDSAARVKYYDYPSGTFGSAPSRAGGSFPAQNAAFNRFCSATLTEKGRLLNAGSGKGYDGQIYFGNEEAGNESRTFGILEDGTTKQLPKLGLASWENTVPAPNRTDTTLVQLQEDGGATSQIYSYVGTKTNAMADDAFDRAGLNNGTLNVVDAADQTVTNDAEFRAKFGKGVQAPVTLSAINPNQTGAAQNTQATAAGLSLNRIEDGHWDPDNPRDYYFVTTEGGDTTAAPGTPSVTRDGGGLWRLRYRSIEDPSLGATLTLLLDGSEAPYLSKPDNMAIDTHGNMLIQEDPGNNAEVARVVAYDINTGRRGVVATFDPAQFTPGAAGFITADEESSGIIDAKDTLGDGRFLFDAQVHKAIPAPDSGGLVEQGQLLSLDVKDFESVYTGRPVLTNGTNGAGGTNGKDGAAGKTGKTGKTGRRGKTGKRGKNGKVGTVKCAVSKSRRKVTCRVATVRASRARLVRASKTVARGSAARGSVRLSSKRALIKGTYRLVVGGRTLSVRLS